MSVFDPESVSQIKHTQPPTIHGYHVPNVNQVKHSVVLYSIAFILGFIIYVLLRVHQTKYVAPKVSTAFFPQYTDSLFKKYFGWIIEQYQMTDQDLIQRIGMDCFLVLILIRFAIKVLVVNGFVSLLALLPMYAMQPQQTHCISYCDVNANKTMAQSYFGECVCGIIDRYSIANVLPSSNSLWVPVFVAIYMAIVTLYMLKVEYDRVAAIKLKFWLLRPPNLYSIYVDQLPKHLTTTKQLENYFNAIFPSKVFSVQLIPGPSDKLETLRTISSSRMDILSLLERTMILEQSKSSKMYHWHLFQGCRRVESTLNYQNELNYLNDEYTQVKGDFNALRLGSNENKLTTPKKVDLHKNVPSAVSPPTTKTNQNEQTESIKRSNNPEIKFFSSVSQSNNDESNSNVFGTPVAAFVTFRHIVTPAICTQSNLSEFGGMRIQPAPEPRDVRWDELGMSSSTQFWRILFVRAIYLFILLFWGVLTSFIGASTSTAELSRQYQIINQIIERYPEIELYLNQFAPLLLIVIVAIVNPLLRFLSVLEGRITESENEQITGSRYFIFLVVQVFLFYSISGTVFKTLIEILQRPQRIVSTLAATLPKNAAFYIQFIVVKWFWTLSITHLRIVECMLAIIRWVIHGKSVTPRERRMNYWGCYHITYPSPLNLSNTHPQLLLVLFIAICYATIHPLVLVAAFVFFVLAELVYTSSMLSATKQLYDSGGTSWSLSFWAITWALIISQLTLSGVLYAKEGYWNTIVVWILTGCTFWAALRIDRMHHHNTRDIPIAIAAKIDNQTSNLSIKQIYPSLWQYSMLTIGQDPSHELKKGDKKIVYNYDLPILNESDSLQAELGTSSSSGLQETIPLITYGSM